MENLRAILIKKAVSLWCEKLKNPMHNNGDDSFQGLFFHLKDIEQKNDTLKEKGIAATIWKFGQELERLLTEDKSEDIWMDVDYNPCTLLCEAAKKVGLSLGQFPIKSEVVVGSKTVTYKFGYGVRDTEIYPVELDGEITWELKA